MADLRTIGFENYRSIKKMSRKEIYIVSYLTCFFPVFMVYYNRYFMLDRYIQKRVV